GGAFGDVVKRGDDFHTWAYTDASADGEAAGRVQEGLLADPGAGADAQGVLEIALEDGIVADVDVVVELDVLGVEDEHPRLDDDAVAAAAQGFSGEGTGAVAASH